MVGDKTIIFRLLDADMYYHMNRNSQNVNIDRGIALHKMIRLITFSTAMGGYLTFMGNEFGHPEWIDFPRIGNNWSYNYARRQWSLAENSELRYFSLKQFEIEMIKGKAHNHPTFAIWLEDSSGQYLQTLFVTAALGQGIYQHGVKSGGTWKPGEVRRPSALPYWAHKWSIKNEYGSYEPTPRNKVPDAYSGATPAGSFRLNTRSNNALIGQVKIFMEINQPWDWNEYWTNALYPNDFDYQASCQPAVVYSAMVDMGNPGTIIEMKPVGHSHYSGNTGELYPDLSSITTALNIASQITVVVK